MTSDDMTDAVDTASKKAMASVRSAKDEASVATSRAIHDGQDAVTDAGSQAGSKASEVYDRAKEHVQAISDNLPNSASDAYRTGRRALAQGGESLGGHVSRQPIEALLLAGAIGFLVGWASSRG